MCKFCNFLSSTTEKSNWYDFAIVFQNEYFVAVPTIGCIVPGYLLVIPKRHVYSMAQLNRTELNNLIVFTQKINGILTEIWSNPIIFEHGACIESKTEDVFRAGSCTDHAHWHLVPGKYDFLSQLPNDINTRKILSFENFVMTDFKNKPYLYYQDNNKIDYIVEHQNPVGQFFRRILAECAGKRDKWDYLLFPEIENIKETLEQIDYFKNHQGDETLRGTPANSD